MILSLPNENFASKLTKRSVMIKSCFELWAQAKTKEHLDEQLKVLPSSLTTPLFSPENTFKMVVEVFNKVMSQEEKIKRIEVYNL